MATSTMRAVGWTLSDLLPGARIVGSRQTRVRNCTCDSRFVQPGDLFVALTGVEHDGHDFVHEAAARGAAAAVVERLVPSHGMPLCLVEDTRQAFGETCHRLAGSPGDELALIAITGTNGKTTTAALTSAIIDAAGGRSGRIGTLGLFDGDSCRSSSLTTPTAPVIANGLTRMIAAGCSHAVMEASSHGLTQHRLAGLQLDAACITNVQRDHLDYHGNMPNYRRAKARILNHLRQGGTLVAAADDEGVRQIADLYQGRKISFGLDVPADVTAMVLQRMAGEQTFLLEAGSETAAVRTRMIGDHHVRNCLAAAALGLSMNIDLQTIARGLQAVEKVPGRLEHIDCGQPFGVYVDYAHTPDALSAVLTTLRQVTAGRVICVFGAGGERDPRKRPLMGAVAEQLADRVIVTSDNPRSEDPGDIAKDILRGVNRPSRTRTVLDRGAAIARALAEAESGDSVLIAGKGHEQYQLIHGRALPFDDRQFVRDQLYRQFAPQPIGS